MAPEGGPLVPPLATAITPIAQALAFAVIGSSTAPLLLLDGDCTIIAASQSFRLAFDLPAGDSALGSIYALGAGEWNVPRLRSLLDATLSAAAAIPAYEIDLISPVHGRRRLVLNANLLDHDSGEKRLLLAVADVTDARLAKQIQEDLVREKAMLMQELQHRVANSLQIVASVLMQSARRVGSDESRGHLRDAHNRVQSIATLQQQLSSTDAGEVDLGIYFEQLCRSLGASMIDDDSRLVLAANTDHSRVDADVSVSLGLVVTELVINALKHAFPDGRRGHIIVDYRSTGSSAGDGWRLMVTDDGIGMAPGRKSEAGLGTSIINALSRHLEAEVQVSSGPAGTIVTVTHTAIAKAGTKAPPAETAV